MNTSTWEPCNASTTRHSWSCVIGGSNANRAPLPQSLLNSSLGVAMTSGGVCSRPSEEPVEPVQHPLEVLNLKHVVTGRLIDLEVLGNPQRCV